jgi:mannose-6-phosphate isomerase-like protein (cupin superfamily)
MIHKGDTIRNPVTGEQVTFLETGADTQGKAVVIDTSVAPGGFVAATHLHPLQSERFEVIAGRAEFRVGDQKLTAEPGDVVLVEPGTPHRFQNTGDEELRFVTEVRPALGFETFLETMFGLAADGKTNRKGLPNPLRLAVIMREHFDLVRLPFPPAFLQKAGLAAGAPLGRLLGYRPTYVRTPPSPSPAGV